MNKANDATTSEQPLIIDLDDTTFKQRCCLQHLPELEFMRRVCVYIYILIQYVKEVFWSRTICFLEDKYR